MTREMLARHVLVHYLMPWGQEASERVEWLNRATKAAGLKATWRQGPRGERAGYFGTDAAIAHDFRSDLHKIDPKEEINEQVRQVAAIIASYRLLVRITNNKHKKETRA